MERYLRVNFLGPNPRLMKKINLPKRGLTKVEKHWSRGVLPSVVCQTECNRGTSTMRGPGPTRAVKVKFTLVQTLKLCTGRTAHRGSRVIALPFLDHGTRRGWGVSVTPQLIFTPGKDPVPIVQETGWAPGPVWTGAKNIATTGIWSPDRPLGLSSYEKKNYRDGMLGDGLHSTELYSVFLE